MQFRKLSASIQRALLGVAAVSAGALATTSALAQESKLDAATLDTVEVTGSRLKRADIEGAVPLIVIDRAAIDASGDVSVAEVLRDTTFASFGNFKPQSGSSAQSLATIDLRGTGSGRTLVLIDGRRAPTNPMSASSGSDLNAIPLAAVERIEILSDGASAVYGSDAIGGVVNIIMRKDFNGAEIRYGVGSTEVKGGDLQDMSLVFGSSSDRTRVIGGVSSSKRGMVFTRDQIGGQNPGVSTFGNNYYNWDSQSISAVPGFSCDQGAFYFLGNGLCSFNFNSVAANDAKVDNTSVFVRADHQINDRWNVYAAGTISKVETFGRYAPVPGVVVVDDGTPSDINSGVACGAGGCTPGTTDGLPTFYYHRFAAAGNRDNFTDTTNSDFLVGFQGRLTDTIGIDFGLRHTDYKFIELGRGYIVATLANAAANSGDYDLRNPYAADPSVLSGMQATINRDSRWTTDEIYGLLSFDLFEMGGGMSNGVFGVEYREDNLVDQYDSLSEAGLVLGSSGNSSAGSRDAKAAYFEWLLPFSSTFDISLAGRFDSYSDYGNDFSPKVAMRWQPLENLTLRGSYGEGFRAPGLDILTQKTTFSAESVNDPQSCAALGEPTTCQLQVNTFFQANPELESEQSRQFSVGAVWDPLEWLDFSIDYYAIEVENTINQITPQSIINSDLDPAQFGPIPPGMSITRMANGAIDQIIAGYANQGTLDTDGIDFRVNTRFDLGGYGELRNQLTVSYINSYEIDDGLGNVTEYLDINGYPDRRASLNNTWTVGDFTVGLNTNYIGENGPVGGYATNDVQLSWQAPWNGSITLGATNVGDRYPELVPFDGRPWNFYLYDAYGRTTYLRYTQAF